MHTNITGSTNLLDLLKKKTNRSEDLEEVLSEKYEYNLINVN